MEKKTVNARDTRRRKLSTKKNTIKEKRRQKQNEDG